MADTKAVQKLISFLKKNVVSHMILWGSCNGLFLFIACWVRYGSHLHIRYRTDLIIFHLLLLNIMECDLYFDSHILLCLFLTLILIIHIICIKCVFVGEYYEYSLTVNKSLLLLLL